jgi:prophage regulatory protein
VSKYTRSQAAESSQGLPKDGFVRLPQVLRVFPVGKSTWWAGVKAGKYPAPVKLSANVTAWRVADIRSLIETHSAPMQGGVA